VGSVSIEKPFFVDQPQKMGFLEEKDAFAMQGLTGFVSMLNRHFGGNPDQNGKADHQQTDLSTMQISNNASTAQNFNQLPVVDAFKTCNHR